MKTVRCRRSPGILIGRVKRREAGLLGGSTPLGSVYDTEDVKAVHIILFAL